jgi:hypothetical protein
VGVKRDGEDAAHHASVEGGDPLGAVFRPEEDAVAGADAALGEERGETAGETGDFSVSGCAPAVALVTNHCDLATIAAKVVEECG